MTNEYEGTNHVCILFSCIDFTDGFVFCFTYISMFLASPLRQQLPRSWCGVEAPDPQRAADLQLEWSWSFRPESSFPAAGVKLNLPREQLTRSWCEVESPQRAADLQLVWSWISPESSWPAAGVKLKLPREQLTRSWCEVGAPDPQRAAGVKLKLPIKEQFPRSWCGVEAPDQRAASPQLQWSWSSRTASSWPAAAVKLNFRLGIIRPALSGARQMAASQCIHAICR